MIVPVVFGSRSFPSSDPPFSVCVQTALHHSYSFIFSYKVRNTKDEIRAGVRGPSETEGRRWFVDIHHHPQAHKKAPTTNPFPTFSIQDNLRNTIARTHPSP